MCLGQFMFPTSNVCFPQTKNTAHTHTLRNFPSCESNTYFFTAKMLCGGRGTREREERFKGFWQIKASGSWDMKMTHAFSENITHTCMAMVQPPLQDTSKHNTHYTTHIFLSILPHWTYHVCAHSDTWNQDTSLIRAYHKAGRWQEKLKHFVSREIRTPR